jgi:hypothetical protein
VRVGQVDVTVWVGGHVVCAMGRVSQNGVGRVDVGPVVVPGGEAISTTFPVTGEAILHFLLEAG